MSNLRPLCDWCGKRCNGYIFNESFLGFFNPMGKQFCSKRCLSYYQNQTKRETKPKSKTEPKPKSTRPQNFHSQDDFIVPKHRTKEDIDLEFYEKQKEFELEQQREKFEQQQSENISQKRQAKYDNAKKYLDSGGKKYIYYLKMLWAYLDKPWKKIVFVIIIWWLVASLISPFLKN